MDFLYIGKWNFIASNLKKLLYFRRRLSQLKKLKKNHFEKISYIFPIKKVSCISENGTLSAKAGKTPIFFLKKN